MNALVSEWRHASKRCGSMAMHERGGTSLFRGSRKTLAILVTALVCGIVYSASGGQLWQLQCQQTLLHHIHSPQSKGSATSGRIFSGEKIRDFRPPGPPPDPCVLPKLGTNCKDWAVLTTINNVTDSVLNTCNHLRDWCMVVVADTKTPKQYDVSGACHLIFIDVETQKNWAASCAFVAELPWKHFSRKNIGYLAAIVNGAERVWDFDDDNELLSPHPIALEGSPIKAWTLPAFRNDVMNPYPLLGASTFSWPRGFPLSRINDNATTPLRDAVLEGEWPSRRVAVVQSLAQAEPDVDAVYRLTRPLPVTFTHPSNTLLVVPRETSVPFNAQATLFRLRASLWALLLPRTVHGRVSDIWRAYIMQRLMADYGFEIAFSGAWVTQHRNPHSYIADLEAEVPLYLQTSALVRFLAEWKNTAQTLPESALELYVELYERGFLEVEDVMLIKAWLDALSYSGYEFPPRPPFATIFVRTYHKDIVRMNQWLLPTLQMFVDQSQYKFVVVLDDESEKDHAVGACLEANGISVRYEALPAKEGFFLGKAFADKAYARPGYDRQQWSTFHLDRFTESSLIGVMDADAMLFSYLTLSAIMDSRRRIHMRAMPGNHYENDKAALKEPTPYDFMWVDRFPIWLWRDTYQHVRNHIASKWNATFDDAFAEFSKGPFSQFDIMSTYAVQHSNAWYGLVLPDDASGVVSVGCNRCREEDIASGCCTTYGKCSGAENDFLTRYNYVPVSWSPRITDAYKKSIPVFPADHPGRKACETYLAGKYKPICMDL